MKKMFLVVAIALVFLLGAIDVGAKGIDTDKFFVDLKVSQTFYNSENLESEKGLKLKAGYDFGYLWGAYERALNRYSGQEAGDIGMWGIGGGLQYFITENLRLFAEVGWYDPNSSMEGVVTSGPNHEALWLELNRRVALPDGKGRSFDYYEYDLRGNIGGSLGVDFCYEIINRLTLGLSVSYRFLKLPESIYGRYYIAPEWWEVFGDKDFSGVQLFAGLTYRW